MSIKDTIVGEGADLYPDPARWRRIRYDVKSKIADILIASVNMQK